MEPCEIAESLNDDSDTEIDGTYFLRPVNEYNMTEKIQLANDLLFASPKKEDEPSSTNETHNKDANLKLYAKHRVTFSSDIEEFGDNEISIDSCENINQHCIDDDEQINEELNQIFENDGKELSTLDGSIDKSTCKRREESSDISEIDEDECVIETECENVVEIAEEINYLSKDDDNDHDIAALEQIEKQLSTQLLIQNNTHSGVSALMRLAVPQLIQPTGCITPDLLDIFNASTALENKKNIKEANNINATESSSKGATKRVRPTSARQKITIQSVSQKNVNEKRKCFSTSSECLKLQLNFKQCCEHKYLENERLPRYTGYISEYGLSKDQLDEKELRRKMNNQRKFENRQHFLKTKQLKSQINEAAFRQWLRNKCKNTRDKTKNMYDANLKKTRSAKNSAEKCN